MQEVAHMMLTLLPLFLHQPITQSLHLGSWEGKDCLMSVTGDLVICILKSASVGEYFAMFGAAQLV